MKLKNKLIPIMSVVAATTVAAPLTACGNVSTSSMEMIDVLNGYVPGIQKALGSTTLTAKQVEDLYIQEVKENPDILIQDLAWWESMNMKYRLYEAVYSTNSYGPYIGTTSGFRYDLVSKYNLSVNDNEISIIPKVAKFGMSDIKIDQVTLFNPTTHKQEKINTISLKFNYEYEYDLIADAYCETGRYVAKRNQKFSLASSYKNIPFTVEWDSGKQTWIVETSAWKANSEWIMKLLTNWDFDFDYVQLTNDTITDLAGNVDTYSYDESMSGYIDTVAKIKSWKDGKNLTLTNNLTNTWASDYSIRTIVFSFGSFHLYDIMAPRWTLDTFGYLGDNESYGWGVNSSFEYDPDAGKNGLFGLGNIGLNSSYLEYLSGHIPSTVALPENLSINPIPVYENDYIGEDPQQPSYYLHILPENNTKMLYSKGATEHRVGFTVVLKDPLNNPVNIEEEFEGESDVDHFLSFLNNYHFTFPKGNIPVTVTYDDETESTLYIPVEEDIAMPWTTGAGANTPESGGM